MLEAPEDEALFRRVGRRLIPFLFLCYISAYLDRVNVGFARLQMAADLGFSDVAYGFGAGIFFLGYFLFEVPSNLALRRFGARVWMARIMIVWGVLSAAMCLVRGRHSFYALRFFLGVAEAGFFPGVIWYLTRWFPPERRARSVAAFMMAVAVCGVIGGPVSGGILKGMDGVAGLRGWQWLFIVEGLPAVVLGVVALFLLDESPEGAAWLAPDERRRIATLLAADENAAAPSGLGDVFRTGIVWRMCLVYFGIVMGLYGVSFWLPQIIKDMGISDPVTVGLVSAGPWAAGAVAMRLAARHSDQTGSRRLHVAAAASTGAVGFLAAGVLTSSPLAALTALAVATAGVLGAAAVFWSLPSSRLSGVAAAAGIAWINSVGNLAGQASPTMIGWLRQQTGSTSAALIALAVSLFVAAAAVLTLADVKNVETSSVS